MLPSKDKSATNVETVKASRNIARKAGYEYMLPDWCTQINSGVHVDELLMEIEQVRENQPFNKNMKEKTKKKRLKQFNQVQNLFL